VHNGVQHTHKHTHTHTHKHTHTEPGGGFDVVHNGVQHSLLAGCRYREEHYLHILRVTVMVLQSDGYAVTK
jgi:hypothetical protein